MGNGLAPNQASIYLGSLNPLYGTGDVTINILQELGFNTRKDFTLHRNNGLVIDLTLGTKILIPRGYSLAIDLVSGFHIPKCFPSEGQVVFGGGGGQYTQYNLKPGAYVIVTSAFRCE